MAAGLLWLSLVIVRAESAPDAVHAVEVPRRVLVIHGSELKGADKSPPPIDSMTATHFQSLLEWMGYDLDFLDAAKKPLPAPLPKSYGGVIVDEMLSLHAATREALLDWLRSVRQQRVPILFVGDIPFTDDDIRDEFASAFDLSGDMRVVFGARDVKIARLDEVMMAGETKPEPRAMGFKNFVAPPSAHVCLSLEGQSPTGKPVRFDPVFLAEWGGAWLEPYVALRGSQASRFFYADAIRFLTEWIGKDRVFPAPDTTTRDGRRIFYSHIDGDGFASLTHFPGHPTCAEVVRDRVLQKYPLPITVSVIEADIRGWLKSLRKDDAPRYEAIAQSIYRLPNIQAASHSFSHPFIWDATDPNPGHYNSAKTTLSDDVAYPKVDPVREIKGSIEFINDRLLPKDKHVELMLWSGNCRPGVAALRMCRELGVENMNGGDTIISKLYPSITGVGPRLAKWDDEIQIFAANQNEFMYANGFQGPYFGGFSHVIDTFELTDKPLRLKPVNVYYHFYSATYLSSCRALEQIHQWCMSQPLHPITALEYAGIVRDAHSARVLEKAPRHWLLETQGKLRTFRLPASAGVPLLSKCKGIIGSKREGDMLYVHTDGREQCELVLGDKAEAVHPYLVESSADVSVQALTASRIALTVGGWNSVSLEIAGLPQDVDCKFTDAKRESIVRSDRSGSVRLTVAPRSTLAVEVPSPYAAAH